MQQFEAPPNIVNGTPPLRFRAAVDLALALGRKCEGTSQRWQGFFSIGRG